jgi:hypothetical protein
MPAVADVNATACCVPTAAANCFSSSADWLPVVIHPDCSTFVTAAMSSAVMDGRENGKNGNVAAFGDAGDDMTGVARSGLAAGGNALSVLDI